jgi:phosphatidylglycerophosphatase A
MFKIISTVLFIGLLKRAQATVASIAGFLLFYIPYSIEYKFSAYAFLSIVFLISTYIYVKTLLIKDEKIIVTDEFLAAAIIPFLFPHEIISGIACLFLYRMFDLIKIWPINKIDKINHWLMIFLDDYIAVFYAIVLVFLFNYIFF